MNDLKGIMKYLWYMYITYYYTNKIIHTHTYVPTLTQKTPNYNKPNFY